MKIKGFKFPIEKARLMIGSSSIRLEDAKIQGDVLIANPLYQKLHPDQPEKEKCSFLDIEISARINDKDSIRKLGAVKKLQDKAKEK